MLSWIWKGTQYWNASSLWYGKHLTNSGSLIKYLWYLILPRLVWAYILSDLGRNGMLDWYLVRVEHKSLRGKKLYLKSLGKKQDIKYRKASVDFSSLIANKGCCQWPVHFVCSVEVDSESSLSVEGPLFTWRDFGGTACFISIHLNGPSQLYKPLPWQQNVTQVPAWISDSGILLGLHPGYIGATGFLHFFLLEHSSGPRLSHSYGLMRSLKLAWPLFPLAAWSAPGPA